MGLLVTLNLVLLKIVGTERDFFNQAYKIGCVA